MALLSCIFAINAGSGRENSQAKHTATKLNRIVGNAMRMNHWPQLKETPVSCE